MVTGYKAFNCDMTNQYGKKFVIGKTYYANGEVKFGPSGNGFHMCKNLCDVFRYFPFMEVKVCCVTGSGIVRVYNDEYYGYYDMYSVERIRINYIISREDIIRLMMNDYNEYDNRKFLMSFRLNKEEILMYAKKYERNISVLCYLLYYQMGIENIFLMNAKNQEEMVRKFLNL